MTAAEFAEELAYYNVEPWGDEWARTSLQTSLFFNANKRRNDPAMQADGFIPRRRAERKQTPEEVMRRLNLIFRAKLAHDKRHA